MNNNINLNTFNALCLSTINASGTSERALYCALSTEMFFGQKSSLELRVDKDLAQPYFTVPLPALESMNTATKKQLLLISCLQETEKQLKQLSATMPISTIERLVIVTSILSPTQASNELDTNSAENSYKSDKAKEDWQHMVTSCVGDYLPHFNEKLSFSYSSTPSFEPTLYQLIKQGGQTDIFDRPILVINVESLLDYNDVKTLSNSIEIQSVQGKSGIMPSEGASSTLLIPSQYPEIINNKVVTIESLKNHQQQNIKEQLTQAKFTLPTTTLHVGTISEQWVAHWYDQTYSFYHHQQCDEQLSGNQQSENTKNIHIAKELTLYDQSKVLGYLGIANLTTAIASASSILASPIENASVIWLVDHHVNSNNTQQPVANVYKVTSAGRA